MKVLFITVGYLPMPPVEGGAVENLINLFLVNNEIKEDHEITVYSCNSEKASYATLNYKKSKFKYVNTKSLFFKFSRLTSYFSNFITRHYKGNSFIKLVKKNILIENNLHDIMIIENRPEYIIPLKKIFENKIVLHLHNDYIYQDISNGKKIIDLYDEVFAVSDYIKERVQTVESLTPVRTLYNGIDTSKFDKELYKEEIRFIKEKYSIQEDEVIILYTGRLNKSKGVKELIEAFVAMPSNIRSRLIIVGSSVYGKNKKDSYLALLKKISNSRSKDVIFTGYIDYEKIPIYYSMAHIGVVPSILPEAFALSVVEHLASSNPVITTMVGGIANIVNPECAIIVNPCVEKLSESIKDALIYLCSNEIIRNNMGLAAKKTAGQFSQNKYYENFNKLIYNVSNKI